MNTKNLTFGLHPRISYSSSSHQMTPLHCAVKRNDLGTVKYLVGQGVDTNINVKDGNGVSKKTIRTVDSKYYNSLTITFC